MTLPDVAIVGAGITGCSAAYRLAKAGAKVTVVDSFGPAAMASGWTLAGVRQSGRHPAELPLARRAVALWADLDAELDAATQYRQDGNLRLARNPSEVETIRTLVAEQSALGLDLAFLEDGPPLRAIAPAVSEDVLAASFCPTDGHADPVASVGAFVAAARRHGADFRFGERVEAIEVAAGRFCALRTSAGLLAAGRCILAGGIGANALLEPLGLAIPLRIPMVTVIQTAPLPSLLAPVLGVANADCAARQQTDGCLRVTSGVQDWHGEMTESGDGWPKVEPTAASVRRTIDLVGAVLPRFREARVRRIWAGLLDLTPDALPVIDLAPGVDGLILAAGFSGHGFGIGPATGEILRDLALGHEPELPIPAFAYDRTALRGSAGEPAALTLHG
ncbi:NAD(P)/FAD-dependent oxidoreductase [Pelagibius sp.]|uniref:NAD(P)/FAD-dependent oxidoreductase n=1 Tax=Pelagibius sp. TaxID=1931238 RepID=UPI003B5057AC